MSNVFFFFSSYTFALLFFFMKYPKTYAAPAHSIGKGWSVKKAGNTKLNDGDL